MENIVASEFWFEGSFPVLFRARYWNVYAGKVCFVQNVLHRVGTFLKCTFYQSSGRQEIKSEVRPTRMLKQIIYFNFNLILQILRYAAMVLRV